MLICSDICTSMTCCPSPQVRLPTHSSQSLVVAPRWMTPLRWTPWTCCKQWRKRTAGWLARRREEAAGGKGRLHQGEDMKDLTQMSWLTAGGRQAAEGREMLQVLSMGRRCLGKDLHQECPFRLLCVVHLVMGGIQYCSSQWSQLQVVLDCSPLHLPLPLPL